MNSKLKLVIALATITGVGVTAYCAAQDSKCAQKIIDKENGIRFISDPEESKELTRKEKLKMTWRCYYKTGIAFALTAAGVVYLHKVNLKDLAVVTGIAAVYKARGEAFETTVKEVVGEDTYEKLKMEASKLEIVDKAKNELKGLMPSSHKHVLIENVTTIDEDGDLVYEDLLGGYFRVKLDRVYNAQNKVINAIIDGIPVGIDDYRDMWWEAVPRLKLKKVKKPKTFRKSQVGDLAGWIGWSQEPVDRLSESDMDALKFDNHTVFDDDFGENVTVASWRCDWYEPVLKYLEYDAE